MFGSTIYFGKFPNHSTKQLNEAAEKSYSELLSSFYFLVPPTTQHFFPRTFSSRQSAYKCPHLLQYI